MRTLLCTRRSKNPASDRRYIDFRRPRPPSRKRKRGREPPQCFARPVEAGPDFRRKLVPVAARASAAATAAARLRPRLVDRQRPSAVFLAGQRLDRGARLGVIAELHEAEALGSAGLTVRDDGDRVDASVLREEIAEVILRRVVGEVSNIKLHRDMILFRRSLFRLTDAPLDGARPSRGSSDLVECETGCGRRARTRRRTGYQLEPRKQGRKAGRITAPAPRENGNSAVNRLRKI